MDSWRARTTVFKLQERKLEEMETKSLSRRDLLVHDAATFATLALTTVAVFVVTLLLFRSFSAHRASLALTWEEQGRHALQAGRADEAVQDFRTALTFAPGNAVYELLLAKSLAAAGPTHTNEAYNYFTGLWDATPGDGEINLELARLSVRRGDFERAVDFYRNAIDGLWSKDGVERRREVQLELARFWLTRGNTSSARNQLLEIADSASNDPVAELETARLLAKAGDSNGALTSYRRALAIKPEVSVMAEAGQLAYASGDFVAALPLLQRAAEIDEQVAVMRNEVVRLVLLEPSRHLPAIERVRRIQSARAVARRRWDSCAKLKPLPPGLEELAARWKSPEATANGTTLLQNPAGQDVAVRLIYDTETETKDVCGPPTGEDALLLKLALAPGATER